MAEENDDADQNPDFFFFFLILVDLKRLRFCTKIQRESILTFLKQY